MNTSARSQHNASTLLTVERGMQVLRAFRSDCAPLANSELVRRTGFSKAAVSRLTGTLLQLGFLRHVPGGREFELAAGPLPMGRAFIATSELLQAANPLMQEIADRLDVSVALAIRDGLDVLYIGYRASHRVGTLRLGVGSVLPMGTTAIGRAYLWGLAKAEQKQLVSELKRSAGLQGSALERGIRESFTELENAGTCAVLGGFQRDAYGVALPVWVGRRRMLMAMSCGKADIQPDMVAERKRIAPTLKKAAMQFEQRLAGLDGLP